MKKTVLFAALVASLASLASTNRLEVLTVREDGTIPNHSNVVATASQIAQLQAKMLIAAEAARQAESIYGQTTGELQRVAAMLNRNQTIAYADYYLVSFESAMIIDGNRDKVALFGWEEAPVERRMQGRKSFDCYYAFKGECDIQEIKQIFKVSGVISQSRDEWEYLADEYVNDPINLGEPYTDKDGVVYNYTYRTTVHLPDMGAYFLIIHIRDQAADTDGSTVLMHGGDAGCLTGEVTLGDATIRLQGGRAVQWIRRDE